MSATQPPALSYTKTIGVPLVDEVSWRIPGDWRKSAKPSVARIRAMRLSQAAWASRRDAPISAAAYRGLVLVKVVVPAWLRTVFTLTPRSAAIRSLSRPRAAASTIWALSQSRYGVFAPRTRFFSVLRSAAVSVTGTAAGIIGVSPRLNYSNVIHSRAQDHNQDRPPETAR